MKRQSRHFSTVSHFNWEPLNRVEPHFFLNRLEPSVLQVIFPRLFFMQISHKLAALKNNLFSVFKNICRDSLLVS